jgi:hypothetical protein
MLLRYARARYWSGVSVPVDRAHLRRRNGLQLASSWTRDGRSITGVWRAGINEGEQ